MHIKVQLVLSYFKLCFKILLLDLPLHFIVGNTDYLKTADNMLEIKYKIIYCM